MSTKHNNKLFMVDYDDVDRTVPECDINVLPGRLAALSHPQNQTEGIIVPHREIYHPDVCTVVSSGLWFVNEGEVWLLAPDHGAYYPDISPDGRECRLIGVVVPWHESLLGRLDADGSIWPAPGWMVIKRETPDYKGDLEVPDSVKGEKDYGEVIASCGTEFQAFHKGERVTFSGCRTYELTEDRVLVQAPICSRRWLQSLTQAS